MSDAIRIGDLVVCASPRFREQVGLGLDVGLYLVDRRRDGQVYFARPDRSAWIPKNCLKRVEADDSRVVAAPDSIVRLHRLMRLVEASDIEMERSEERPELEARVGAGPIDAVKLKQIQELLGSDAVRLEFRPGGMHRLVLAFPLGAT